MRTVVRRLAPRQYRALRVAKRVVKRSVFLALAAIFAPKVLIFFLCCGLLDVLRNQHRNYATLDRYFAGNGVLTWLLSPFNLLMDVLALPYWNQGIYRLADLPQDYQDEINAVIAAAHQHELVEKLATRVEGKQRGMIFFKWYGKNLPTSLDVPEFHRPYRFIRTIGVSIFNKKQSTGKHFGPLRVTLRVLYNINTIDNKNVYIKVGNRTNRWSENKLFIFDDTLQHRSCNESDGVRYCLFVDILRRVAARACCSAVLAGVRLILARCNAIFYRHWTFIK